MRNAFCRSLLASSRDPRFVFLTGDLGFQALEPLRDAAGPRFINAGVAEQNMVSVAAGLAWTGLRPWVYSIAPFLYARPYEQIRNDVCAHRLPVVLVGNGGGYGYGVMGATHHALEDYGSLLCLAGLRAFVPAFAADVAAVAAALTECSFPAYLRLGRCELPSGVAAPPYAPWRRLLSGKGPTILAVGPLAGGLLGALAGASAESRPSVWVVAELPIHGARLPPEFLADIENSGHLVVVEEHVAHGGAGQMIAHALASLGRTPPRFSHRCAAGYPTGRFGSQAFHRKECGLDPASVLQCTTGG